MGLSISVGLLDDLARHDAEGLAYQRGAFARLTKALADEGITWSEPEAGDPPAPPAVSGGFPYSYLRHLRRVFVLRRLGEPLVSAHDADEAQYARDCELIDDEMTMFDSHLLCHADDSGYYVPVDFSDPLFLDAEAGVEGGGMVGSSQRLLAELVRMAPSLGIHVEEDGAVRDDAEPISAVPADAVPADAVPADAGEPGSGAGQEPNTSFEMERFAWHLLHRACRASIAGGHAIVFC